MAMLDLIETYKLLNGYYDVDWSMFFTLSPGLILCCYTYVRNCVQGKCVARHRYIIILKDRLIVANRHT